MASNSDVLLTFKTDTGEVTKSLAEIEKALDGVKDAADETGNAVSDIEGASKNAQRGFKLFDTALKASGVVFIISKIVEFSAVLLENKKVAETVEVVTRGIGAAFNVLFEAVEPLGQALFDAFNNPLDTLKSFGDLIKQKVTDRINAVIEGVGLLGTALKLVFEGEFGAAADAAAEGFRNIAYEGTLLQAAVEGGAEAVSTFAKRVVEDTKEAITASTDLTKAQQALRDEQRELNVSYAEAKSQIEQLKLARDDQRKSIDERIAAAEEAAALDLEFAKQREDIALRNVALIEEEIRLNGDSIERQDRLAEARIAAAEATETSAGKQAELIVSIYGLEQERQAQIDEAKAKEAELEKQREENAQKERDRKKQDRLDEIALQNAKVELAKNALGAIAALSDAFAGQDEESQKKAFKRNKALALATAVVNTGQAVVNALTAGGNPLKLATGAQFVEAGIAATVGAAQIATIAKSQFQGGQATAPGSVQQPSRATDQPAAAPAIDLSFLGDGAGQTGIRAYVFANEVTNNQQANQKLNDIAAL